MFEILRKFNNINYFRLILNLYKVVFLVVHILMIEVHGIVSHLFNP